MQKPKKSGAVTGYPFWARFEPSEWTYIVCAQT